MSRIQSIQRNLLIIGKLRSSNYVSFEELTEHVRKELHFRGIDDSGTSRRSLQRDLQNIRTELGVDIEYCRSNRGYYIADGKEKADIDRLLDSFDLLTSIQTESGIPDFVVFERHRSQGVRYLYPLIKAIKEELCVSFNYLKFGEKIPTQRLVEPYAVKEFNGRWYLIGRTPGEKEFKTYGLDRIKELEVTGDRFRTDKAIEIVALFKDCYGIYSTDNFPVQEVILSFGKYDGGYLRSLPLHPSQEILKDEDDEFRIRLKLRITYDFIMAVLSRSWSVKVIEPESLREEVCKICRSAIERNS